jgi:hypothetical protein
MTGSNIQSCLTLLFDRRYGRRSQDLTGDRVESGDRDAEATSGGHQRITRLSAQSGSTG